MELFFDDRHQGHEMPREKKSVCALSKTRLVEEGSIREIGSNFTLFWNVKEANEQRICREDQRRASTALSSLSSVMVQC